MGIRPYRRFGYALFAVHNGYYWSPPHCAYIRLTPSNTGQFIVEMCDGETFPEMMSGVAVVHGEVRVPWYEWWHDPGVLKESPALRAREKLRVTKYVKFVVNADGVEVQS